MEPIPTESDHPSGEDFVHIDNPNPNVVDALSDSIVNVEKEEEEEEEEEEAAAAAEEIRDEDNYDRNDGDVSRSERSDSSERRNVELPEEIARSVMVLSCESSAEGGNCDVYLVGTAHVSLARARHGFCLESCREVEAVISYLKPQVVFLELCSSRVAVLTPQNLKVASRLEVFPGSEFRVAFEEAMKYGGKVILGDRPVQLKDMDDVDMLTLVIQEMSKEFPTLMETLVHERDQFMSSTLLRTASEHSSVVAVVGKGHLQGIKKYWKQPVLIDDLMTVPSKKPTVSTGKILVSLGIAAAGVAIASGIYLAGKK
ncbi:uncharacterized protein F383_30087 [Gossypium arboreum]|uniref:TraB domain-containing protein-like n=1 Tax=Gossypium arboreum TaxID=29729 RepID=A0A0B0PFX3_GOSAR|nr:uncharacterized protein F383_30087 [Gossypium arboreum]